MHAHMYDAGPEHPPPPHPMASHPPALGLAWAPGQSWFRCLPPPPVVVPLVFAIFEGMQEHRPSLQT